MNKPGLILGGLALLYWGVLRGAKALIVGVKDYAFRGFDINNGTVQLYLNILVKNPLLIGVTVKSVEGDVYIQGQRVGWINTTMNYYLSGGHTHVLPVIVNLYLRSVGGAFMANIQSGDIRTLEVAFDGKIYLSEYNVPLPVQKELTWEDMTNDKQ